VEKKHHRTQFAMVSDPTCSMAFPPFVAGPSEHSKDSMEWNTIDEGGLATYGLHVFWVLAPFTGFVAA
jgi:hypothetical protein